MRILHVTKKYPNALGGDATGSSNLEREQGKLGHEVFILTTNCDEIIDKENVIKFGLKTNSKDWDFINFKRLFSLFSLFFYSFSLIKKIKPDIVHSHSADLGFILSFACRKYSIPIINQCRGVSFPYKENPWANRFFEKFCLKNGKFNKIITVDANSLGAFRNTKIKNVEYMPNGINLDKFNLKKEKNKTKKIKFIFVGRLENQKGLVYLIKSVNILKSKNLNFEVDLVGDGSLKEYLQNEIKKFNLNNYFNFLGSKNKKDVINQYFKSDIFILPSIWEGFPNTLLEAWGASLPVIITNVGGISKICKNGKNVLLVPKKNPEKLADAMLTLIKNKRLREKLGRNGRKLVELKYTWEKVNNSFMKIYNGVVKNDPKK